MSSIKGFSEIKSQDLNIITSLPVISCPDESLCILLHKTTSVFRSACLVNGKMASRLIVLSCYYYLLVHFLDCLGNQ